MRIIIGISVFLVLLTSLSFADRGAIPFMENAGIFEPDQNAFIAWNGSEEILVLSTNMYSSEPTKVLEVMPLPSEPVVKKSNTEMFKKAVDLINAKHEWLFGIKTLRSEASRLAEKSPGAAQPAAELKFHQKIGAHDLSTLHVLDSARFIKWVEDYLSSSGVNNPKIPDTLKSSIDQYLSDGYKWFIFDVIELDNAIKTNEAIEYRFASKQLYYPLRISRTNKGQTAISLIVLTPQLISKFPGLAAGKIELENKPLAITAEELKKIDQSVYDFLGKYPSIKLRIWKIRGGLSSFNQDLLGEGFASDSQSAEEYTDLYKHFLYPLK